MEQPETKHAQITKEAVAQGTGTLPWLDPFASATRWLAGALDLNVPRMGWLVGARHDISWLPLE